ncbi:MAG: phospholipase D-like domain-containing protein, partial [Eggerthellales bacterium]|nr:phospholipase D-like domain-containing protein [Eggerthellales bacterium]
MTSGNGEFVHEVIEFKAALEAGYIDASTSADERFAPRFVTNDAERAETLLSVIQHQLQECDSFDFSVAFVTSGGLSPLMESLQELKRRGIKGRILTTTYNNFNKPEVLRKLLEFPNIEARVFQGGFHAKGYLFNKEGVSTVIVGSSNLTQKALLVNKEWNILFHSYADGRMLKE